jgi:hypothetical protein
VPSGFATILAWTARSERRSASETGTEIATGASSPLSSSSPSEIACAQGGDGADAGADGGARGRDGGAAAGRARGAGRVAGLWRRGAAAAARRTRIAQTTSSVAVRAPTSPDV